MAWLYLNMKKFLFSLLGTAAGICAVLVLPDALSFSARAALGALVGSIIWWIAGVLPDFMTAMLMAVLFMSVCHVPVQTVFSAFSGSAWWLLMAAFGLSLGVTKSGLMHRISLYVLKIFPCTFAGQVLGLMTVGAVTAPFIPSMSAKSTMMAPLTMEISDSMGFSRKGKAGSGLFLAMLVGLRNPGPLFISASVLGYAFLGQYPAAYAEKYTMAYWLTAALPWFLCVSVLNFLMLLVLFKPKQAAVFDQQIFRRALQTLGPLSRSEKQMLCILIATMALWATESVHGIAAHVVAIAALCVMLACGILDQKQFCTEMNWGPILYIGIVLGLPAVFAYLGIDAWIMELSGGLFARFAADPYLFLLCIGIVTVLLRFVIVSEAALVGVVMAFLVPLSIQLGIQPWIVGFAVYALISPWFFHYQNPVYMAAYYAVDGQFGRHGAMAGYCAVYCLICLAGLMLSVPYWEWMGMYSL